MVYKAHRWFTPAVHVEPEVFEMYRTTHQFYDEVQHRESLSRYCEWYQSVAEQHRRELEQIRGDINIFGWFRRKS